MIRALKINSLDNTATLFANAGTGEPVSIVLESGQEIAQIKALQDVSVVHKIALADIPAGEKVTKYGEVFGLTTCRINKGDHVHVHNVVSAVLPRSRT
jgi:altronate dehydratase small subunit